MHILKYLAVIVAAFILALSCLAAEPPMLDKAQVLRIALDYAREQRWDIINVWEDMPDFNDTSRQWRVFINTKQNGGPMIVHIDDKTKKVWFHRGE